MSPIIFTGGLYGLVSFCYDLFLDEFHDAGCVAFYYYFSILCFIFGKDFRVKSWKAISCYASVHLLEGRGLLGKKCVEHILY